MQSYVGRQIDRYRIMDKLGTGGMAVVYQAYDVRLQRDVAFKLIRTDTVPAGGHERLVQRFEREARAMAKLSHPNIVSVHDYGDHEGVPYLVMGYVPGGTLKDLIGSPLPYQKAAAYLLPIADALAYAHDQGILHRDVKPSNILITADNKPMLTDFGIAKILEEQDSSLTSTGFGVGTPQYMAPEQWRNEVCPQTDIYSLGTIFYELITGHKPYDAETPAAIAVKQATEPLIRPRTFISDIPESVEKVIYKALAFKPVDRYEDMNVLQNALQELRDGQLTDVLKEDLPKQAYVPSHQTSIESENETRDELEETPSNIDLKADTSQQLRKRKIPKWAPWAGGGLVLAIILCVFSGFLINRILPIFQKNEQLAASLSVGDTKQPTLTITTVSDTMTATSILHTATVTTEPTARLGVGSTIVNEIDGANMVYVPAGEFLMGSEDSDTLADERPEHTVYLNGYWIYTTEVTYAQYRKCMESGVCHNLSFPEEQRDHPIIYMSWFDAQEYCSWAGGRLPTEAEWEKAARGTDGRKYPWGSVTPNSNLANYFIDIVDETKPVGSYPQGASPYGALDMAGNVMEWVSDWYDSDYYQVSPGDNPAGPSNGSTKVFRGSSYYASALKLRTTIRHNRNPSDMYDNVGFRCVVDP